MSQQIGIITEQQAWEYLIKQGLKSVTRNYSCRWGEVDLIMLDEDHLVFVEVRARISNEYGGALGSITSHKQNKIIKTASHYMTVKKLYDRYAARFDVIAFQGNTAEIDWIKNAFGVGY